MAGIDYEGYINAILPSYLQNDNAKNLMKAFSNQSEELFLNAQSARKEGMIVECATDDVIYHFGNASGLVSPFESTAEQRAYLGQKFENWKKGGTVEQMKAELARFGYKNTKVVTWSDLIKMGVEHPFGGGFTKIVGLDINGGMTYIPKREDTAVIVQHQISAPSQPLAVFTSGASPGTKTVTIQLQTDAGGFPISKPIEIYKALAKAGVDAYLGYGWLGTGLGTAVGSPPKTLPMGFHSFFYLDIDTPNGFGEPFLWNDNTVSYYNYPSGLPFTRWQDFTLPTLGVGEDATAIWGNSVNNIFIGTNLGGIYRWNGTSWTSIPSGVTYQINHISGSPSSIADIWVVGNSNQALRWNGSAFIAIPMPVSAGGVYNKLYVGGPNNVWAVGNNGTIAYFDGTSFTAQVSGTANNLLGIHGFSGTDIWAVGKSGTILRYNGSSWSAPMHSITADVNCVWGAGASAVWFGLTGFATIYQIGYWDGATVSLQTMSQIPLYPPFNVMNITHIVGTSANEIFAFNFFSDSFVDAFSMLKYNGTEWRATSEKIDATGVTSITESGTTYLFAAGKRDSSDKALVYKSQTTGNWSTVHEYTSAVGTNGACIFGTSDNDIWVSDKSQMLHYNGTSWSTYALPVTLLGEHRFGQSTSTTDAWLVADKTGLGNFSILHWNGTAWSENLTSAPSQSFWANSSTDAWAGTVGGVLKHWDGAVWNNVTLPMTIATADALALWGESATKMVGVFKNGADYYLTRYDGVTWFSFWNSTLSPELKNALAIGGTIWPDVFVYGQDLSDSFSYVQYQKPFPYWSNLHTVTPGPNACNKIYALSPQSVWFKAGNKIYHWDGHQLEDVTQISAGWIPLASIFVAGENSVYNVEADGMTPTSRRIRRFSPTFVPLPKASTGRKWNDGGAWDGQPPYPAALRDLRKIVRKYKPATTSGRFARIQIGAMSIPYSIGESYEEDAYGNLRGPYLSSYLTR